MGYYRADVRSSYNGQAMQNTLYYRDRDPFSGDLVEQCQLLGAALNTYFFPAIEPQWLSLLPDTASVQEWAIMPYTDAGFEPGLSTPVIVDIGRIGYGSDDIMVPGVVAIMRFLLRVAPLTSGLYQPRRSYIAWGPVPHSHVDNNGALVTNSIDAFNLMGDLLAGNVGTVLGAGGWAPVRFGQGPSPLFLRGFAEVDGCRVRPATSYRKSRQPES